MALVTGTGDPGLAFSVYKQMQLRRAYLTDPSKDGKSCRNAHGMVFEQYDFVKYFGEAMVCQYLNVCLFSVARRRFISRAFRAR